MDSPLTPRPTPPRRALPLLLVPIAILVAASNIASLTWASLVDTHPLWLLSLSSLNRYLALTTGQLSAWSYYLVGTTRLLLPDPLFYLLGFWYGDRVLKSLERRSPSVADYYRLFDKLFARFGYPVVFLMPNNPVCLLAGAARMPLAPFAVVNVAGTIARLVLIRALGNIFESPIKATMGFIADYRVPLLIVSALAVAASVWSDRRRGGGELGALRELRDDLDE